MRKFLLIVAITLTILAIAGGAQAQATRTWVSGVGDDVNPCSRTAPCKTYAGAISKTAAGGIISTLDPGGFGALTITKAITVDGSEQIGSMLAAGTNGVVINAGNNDVVVLRNLEIHGAGTGFDGIRILNAKAVIIENVRISSFTSQGIEILPTIANPLKVYVRDCLIRNNTAQGIFVFPSGAGTVQLTVERSTIVQNGSNGIDVAAANNNVSIFDSVIAGNNFGVVLQQTSSNVYIESSQINSNGTGLLSGVAANTPVIRISRCAIVNNTTAGISGPGTVVGFSNNMIVNNGGGVAGNSVSSSAAQQ
ncbi:MAG TPA: right-handed parallel beta-helix repeat-containing protein [Thermoanaerobaculia bacterium]